MKLLVLLGAGLLPLAGAAQQLAATQPPVTYHVGPRRAPLYHNLLDRQGLADTLRRVDLALPARTEAVVVGRATPYWVVVRYKGFLYATPISRLSDYDPGDADELPVDAQTHLITYQGVVAVPGASQAELYARARAWVASTYTQQNAQLEREDPAAGQLRLRGNWPVTIFTDYQGIPRPTYAGVVRHTLSIYVKEGRYKYVMSDFTHDAGQTPNLKSGGALEQNHASLFGYAGLGSRKPWNDLKTAATRDARQLLEGLQTAMTLQKPQPNAPKIPVVKDPSEF